MVCRTVVPNDDLVEATDLNRYYALHTEGKRLINGWFDRAWSKRDCLPERSFEPFIFLWFAFNAWAACVTGKDEDWEWRKALASSPDLNQRFADLVEDPSSQTYTRSREFSAMWPIFKAQKIREKLGFSYYADKSRQEMI